MSAKIKRCSNCKNCTLIKSALYKQYINFGISSPNAHLITNCQGVVSRRESIAPLVAVEPLSTYRCDKHYFVIGGEPYRYVCDDHEEINENTPKSFRKIEE